MNAYDSKKVNLVARYERKKRNSLLKTRYSEYFCCKFYLKNFENSVDIFNLRIQFQLSKSLK